MVGQRRHIKLTTEHGKYCMNRLALSLMEALSASFSVSFVLLQTQTSLNATFLLLLVLITPVSEKSF